MRLLILLLAGSLLSAEQIPRMWKWSAIALAGATTADAVSSWGGVEVNPILAGRDRRFGARGVAIKAGIAAGTLIMQWAIMKRHPKAAKAFSYVNFGIAGSYVGFTIRNTWGCR